MKGDTNQKLPATSKAVCAVIWFHFASSSSPLVINVEKKLFNQKKKLEMNPLKKKKAQKPERFNSPDNLIPGALAFQK